MARAESKEGRLTSINFAILGRLDVRVGNSVVPIRSARQQRLLLALLIAPGLVPSDTLIDVVWPEGRPNGAPRALKGVLDRLREHLGAGAAITIDADGYALVVAADCVDARRFERMLEEADRDAGTNDDRALDLIEQALALWRGGAFEGFAHEQFAKAEAERLEQLRAVALETRFDLRLDRGEHAAVIDELEAAMLEHPLRERLTASFMVAASRCGRSEDARRAYDRLRSEMSRSLGIEPSMRLRRLARSIRAGDPQPSPDSRLTYSARPPNEITSFDRDTGTRRSGVGEARLVGRRRELAVLEDEIERALSGEARAVVVRGDAGIGKTRLVHELVRRNASRLRALRVSCSQQITGPFLPLVQLIEQLAATSNAGSARRPRDVVRRLTRLTTDVARQERDPAPSEIRALLFVDVVRVVVDLLAERPTLCIIEDIQWADRETREVLVAVCDALFGSPRSLSLLLLCTERANEPNASELGAVLERREHARALWLRPLEEIEVDELIRDAGIDRPSRNLVRMMFELSAGNPLYVGESLRRIQQLDGFVEGAGGLETKVSALELGPPADVVHLVQRRLDALPPDAVEVLTVAAIVGDRVDVELLETVLERPVEEAVNVALAHGFFVETTEGVQFAHPLTLRALAERPDRRERRSLHRRVAATLRALPRTEHAGRAAEIAHHLVAGGLDDADEETLIFLWLAGRHVYELGAWSEAARFFDAGVRVAGRLGTDSELTAWMTYASGRAHDQNYDHARAVERYAEVKQLAQENDDVDLLGRAVLSEMRLRELLRKTDGGTSPADTTELDKVLEQIDETRPRLRSRLLAEYCTIEMGRAHPEEGFVLGEEAVALARKSDDSITLAAAESTLGMASLSIGDASSGARQLRTALTHLPRRRRPDLEGITLSRLALTQLMLGDLDGAEERAAAAREAFTSIADHKGECLAETTSAALAMLRGDFAAVEDHAQRAEAHLRVSRDWFAPVVLYPALVETRSAQGDDAGAQSALTAWKATGQAGRGPARLLAAVRAGSIERARTLMGDGRGHQLLAGWPSLFSVGVMGAVAESARAIDRPDVLEPLLYAFDRRRDAAALFSPGWGASAGRVHGMLLEARGESERACRAYEDAVQQYESIGALPELARSHLALGSMLVVEDPDRAHTELAYASALGHRLGMPHVIEAAERALGLFSRQGDEESESARDQKIMMFTDIVESTRVSVESGDDVYMELIDDHDAIVRRNLARHGGAEVHSTGDGVMAAFDAAGPALACVLAILGDVRTRNNATGRAQLALRIGLAVGRPIERAGNLYGAAVNLAARLCAAAMPGEALVDADLYELTREIGRFSPSPPLTLKGFAQPVSAYAVVEG